MTRDEGPFDVGRGSGSQWQPIETAPPRFPDEEGEPILVWVANAGPRKNGKWLGAVAFGCVYASRTNPGYRHAQAHGYGGNNEWEITHWMPLPAPPSLEEP